MFPFGPYRGGTVPLKSPGTRRRRQNLRGLEVAILRGCRRGVGQFSVVVKVSLSYDSEYVHIFGDLRTRRTTWVSSIWLAPTTRGPRG